LFMMLNLVLCRNLPRHMFGNLQSKMFPAYFTLISACAAISVAAFSHLHPWKTASTVERYQLGFLLSALGCNLSNLLVFTPMTIEVSLITLRLWSLFTEERIL
jgi:hypothetical protein